MVPRYFFTTLWRIKRAATLPALLEATQARRGTKARSSAPARSHRTRQEQCMNGRYRDRTQAGRQLADAVAALDLPDPVVLALVRGGLPVALEVARRLKAPLDVLLVRKIGAPFQPELAMAAVAERMSPPLGTLPAVVVDDEVLRDVGATRADVETRLPDALREIERRRAAYGQGRTSPPLAGRSVVVVDDGIATGCTLRAALLAVAAAGPARIVVAVPVAPPDVVAALTHQTRPRLDAVVCPEQPAGFGAVGAHYQRFEQVDDAHVIALLDEAAGTLPTA
jgi:putative phosphoribosyl transferase